MSEPEWLPSSLFHVTVLGGYKCRLRAIVKDAPTWVSEEILSASEHIGDKRAVLWMSEN